MPRTRHLFAAQRLLLTQRLVPPAYKQGLYFFEVGGYTRKYSTLFKTGSVFFPNLSLHAHVVLYIILYPVAVLLLGAIYSIMH